jgi:hypothetical protein
MASNSLYRAQKSIDHRVIDAAETPQATAPRKLAVFVTHGMGQQMPLETLSSTAEGLADHMDSGTGDKVEFRVRTIVAGDRTLQRIECDTRSKSGQPIELHVYEGYWAHLTEGKVRLRDVMSFLNGGALNGLKGPLKYFERYVFGHAVRYTLPWHARLLLLYVTLVINFFAGINALTTLSVVQILTPGSAAAIPFLSGPVMTGFERILVVYLAWTVAVGFWIKVSFDSRQHMRHPSCSPFWRGLTAFVQALTSTWYVLTLLTFMAMLALIVINQTHPQLMARLAADFSPWRREVLIGLWLVLAWLTWFARGKLVQFVGDVAVYISTPKLNQFMGLRREIQDTVSGTARAIYAMRDSNGDFEYDGVGLMGHSLGSVVVYDTLNALLLYDELHPTQRLEAGDRTRLLLTFGSPLDKTAFIFAQQNIDTAGTKGALSAAMQPLIQDYEKYRRIPWVNVHSPRDIIAGDLDFYDDCEQPRYAERRVQNIQDPDALTPIAAHVEHWMNPLIYRQMLEHLGLAQVPMAQ